MLSRFIVEVYADRKSHIEGEKFWGGVLRVVTDERFYNMNGCGYGGWDHLKHLKGEKHPLFGIPLKPEHRAKLAEAKRGYKHSTESREKMAKQRKGRKFSQDHKQRIAQAVSGAKNGGYSKHGCMNPNGRMWLIIDPMGNEFHVRHAKAFCEQQGLPYSSMKSSAQRDGVSLSKGKAAGWSASFKTRAISGGDQLSGFKILPSDL